VNELKAEPGGDVMVAGGATLAKDLIAKGLLDELHLFVNPAAIGTGMTLFPELGAPQQLRLVTAGPFDYGVVGLHYEPKRSEPA
jgi:dihydrofolate reductase